MVRKPVVAGQFYTANPEHLEEEIKGYFIPNATKEEVLGLVAPHAGYMYSGSTAGAVYSRIKPAQTFIILCPNHTGYGKPYAIMTKGSWETPLGNIPIDFQLANQLLTSSKYLEEDHLAHLYEHSIEVHLPFLQVIFKEEPFQIIPICLSHSKFSDYKELGLEIGKGLKNLSKKVVLIASSDMTHYESQSDAQRKDKIAIEAILKLDEDMLLEKVNTLHITMCGYIPTLIMLSAAKELGAKEAELIKYTTSGETTGDYQQVVGYAGIIVK
ncbi:MAG: AmmeMemoRadiSam system protein B [bacterium]|nr:AmmeMemoRadiSam system protein B [bacterium]